MEKLREYLLETMEDNEHVRLVLVNIGVAVAFGALCEYVTGINESQFKGGLIVAFAFLDMFGVALVASSNIAEEKRLDIESVIDEKLQMEQVALQALRQHKELKEIAVSINKQLQEEQELSLKQANELTRVKQDLAGANEKLQVLEKDLAGANKGLAGADELLTRAGKDLAGVRQELAGAKIEINTCKNELSGEKAQARKHLPYITLAKLYNAYKLAESAFKSANSKADAEGKGQAKKAFAEAKQALDNQYQKINN